MMSSECISASDFRLNLKDSAVLKFLSGKVCIESSVPIMILLLIGICPIELKKAIKKKKSIFFFNEYMFVPQHSQEELSEVIT